MVSATFSFTASTVSNLVSFNDITFGFPFHFRKQKSYTQLGLVSTVDVQTQESHAWSEKTISAVLTRTFPAWIIVNIFSPFSEMLKPLKKPGYLKYIYSHTPVVTEKICIADFSFYKKFTLHAPQFKRLPLF